MTAQQRNAELVKLLQADLQGRSESQFAWAQFCATLSKAQALRQVLFPGLQNSAGLIQDITLNGNPAVYNGNPTQDFFNDFIATEECDGTGDYFSTVSNATINVLGTEAIVAAARRGVTWGGIYRYDALKADNFYMSKWTDPATRQFLSYMSAAGNLSANISSTGANQFFTANILVPAATWFININRFTPSTELKCFVNTTVSINTTAIPAALFNPGAPPALTHLAGSGGGGPLDGAFACTFLAAAAWPDILCNQLISYAMDAFGMS